MGSSRRTEGKTSATMHRWAVLLALVLLALVPSLLCLPTAYVYQWKNPTAFSHYQSPPQLVQPHYFATRPSLSKPTSSFLKPESDKTLKLTTELADLGMKHIVTAVAELPNVDPKKKAQFGSIGLVGVTAKETKRLTSLLNELGELGVDVGTSLAKEAGSFAKAIGLDGKTISNLVPFFKDLVGLGSKASTSTNTEDGLEILESIGLDLNSGLAFLKKNNLEISDGLQLLNRLSTSGSAASLTSFSNFSQIFGFGSEPNWIVSIGDFGGAQLEKTNELLTELAELGAAYAISAVAELPDLSPEKRRRYKSVVSFGPNERTRLHNTLVELGELGAEASSALTKADVKAPGLAKLVELLPILKAQSDKMTELAEIGAKYVVSAVADLPDVDPRKKALFQEIGLTGISAEEKARMDSLLLELKELGSNAKIVLTAAATDFVTASSPSQKSTQTTMFAKLVPVLKSLTGLAGSDSYSSNSLRDGLELLDTIGLDLETGLDILSKNNLGISDGLKLLDTVVGDSGSFSLKSLGSLSQLVGFGSLSLGATLGLGTPEQKTQLEKTNKLLTELAELGAVYVVSLVADLPTISSAQRLRYKKVGTVGDKEMARFNSLLKELGELGYDASIAASKAGAKALAKLNKLFPMLKNLGELSFDSDSENFAATRNFFPSSARGSKAYRGSNGLCGSYPCIIHRSSYPSTYQIRRFVQF